MGAVGEVERSGAVGGSAPELRRLVEGDTIKEGTVFSGDMAKFGHVVGGRRDRGCRGPEWVEQWW